MTEENRKGPGKQGGNRRDDRRGGGRPKGGGKGPGRGGGRGDAAKPVRVETYETIREVTRGADFRIEKLVVAEKATHKPVKTEYRLHREGLGAPRSFARLADAQTAATEPLPEPEAPAAEAAPEAEAAAETDGDAATEPEA